MNIKNKSIYLFEEINVAVAERILNEIIEANQESEEDINLFINSVGGEIDSGFAIYDFIKFFNETKENKIYTINTGMAFSMGGMILQAGFERYMFNNARVLIHPATFSIEGNGIIIKDSLKTNILERENKLFRCIKSKSNIDDKTLRKLIKKETYLTAKQSLEYNLIDKII